MRLIIYNNLMSIYKKIVFTCQPKNKMYFTNFGYCPCCERDVKFVSQYDWLRDWYKCENCGCIPRERALSFIIKNVAPNYCNLSIHESSPEQRGASTLLKSKCKFYSSSQYYENVESGDIFNGSLCQNLEHMSFADNEFDLFITQDVFEHIFNPDIAFREINRVLKPGGLHIFTVPIINKFQPTSIRAVKDKTGHTVNIFNPIYHDNPASSTGSLVTIDWGYDIIHHIYEATKMLTAVYNIENLHYGIKADYIDVFVSQKVSPKYPVP